MGVLLLVVNLMFIGCSKGEADSSTTDAAPVDAPAPDARFASAEALFAHARGLLAAEPPDLAAYYALFYWETDDQRVWQRFIEDTAVPSELLNQALETQFKKRDFAKPGKCARATITSDSVSMRDARATATFRGGFNKTRTMQLVKVGNRWWISGYTFEATGKEFLAERPQAQQTIEFVRGFNEFATRDGHRKGVEDITRRLRAGEFKSLEELTSAVKSSMGGV